MEWDGILDGMRCDAGRPSTHWPGDVRARHAPGRETAMGRPQHCARTRLPMHECGARAGSPRGARRHPGARWPRVCNFFRPRPSGARAAQPAAAHSGWRKRQVQVHHDCRTPAARRASRVERVTHHSFDAPSPPTPGAPCACLLRPAGLVSLSAAPPRAAAAKAQYTEAPIEAPLSGRSAPLATRRSPLAVCRLARVGALSPGPATRRVPDAIDQSAHPAQCAPAVATSQQVLPAPPALRPTPRPRREPKSCPPYVHSTRAPVEVSDADQRSAPVPHQVAPVTCPCRRPP